MLINAQICFGMLATLVASQNWKEKEKWTMATQELHSKNSFENIVIHTTRCLKQNFFRVQNFIKMRKKKKWVYFVTRF
jgi:hypothetical protein